MSDPAIEAAERACPLTRNHHRDECARQGRVDAAREALKPIREAYKLWGHPESAEAFAIMAELSELIFTTEELANG